MYTEEAVSADGWVGGTEVEEKLQKLNLLMYFSKMLKPGGPLAELNMGGADANTMTHLVK